MSYILLSRSINVNPQRGETALICAAQAGYYDCVNLLVDGGADKEAKDDVRDMLWANMLISCFDTLNCQ